MKKIYLLLIILALFLVTAIVSSAHSFYLFGISLAFDEDLSSEVIMTAQDFLGTDKNPISYDLDKGLISVHFEPNQKNYVQVNPFVNQVFGMRNENLKHTSGSATLTREQAFDTAESEFNKIPENERSQYKYVEDDAEFDDTYFFTWYRFVDGILIIDEDFMVNVDAVNGNVIAWRRKLFLAKKTALNTIPAITENVAVRVAELRFNDQRAEDFQPYLIINKDELIWVTKIQGQFYPFFVGVDAMTGEIAFTGQLPGDVPSDYAVGSEKKVVESDFIKEIYSR
jgi:Zn-dependent metalloprotease